jgi:hypothetical protein
MWSCGASAFAFNCRHAPPGSVPMAACNLQGRGGGHSLVRDGRCMHVTRHMNGSGYGVVPYFVFVAYL